ncbi:MAG: cryptochrome/photolyase family protein [Burkholderiaceae bacterium]
MGTTSDSRERPATNAALRRLVIVLGDQLDIDSSAFDGFDADHDAVLMAEVQEESTHVWSSRIRIAQFLAAMRHFAVELRSRRRHVEYVTLDSPDNSGRLAGEVQRAVRRWRPERLVMTAPGDWRVLKALQDAARDCDVPLEVRDDRHFFGTVREFRSYARGRKSLRMESFYRQLRERHGILMVDGEPAGGRWNFDTDNRAPFGASGPPGRPQPVRREPDRITQDVLALVAERFPDHPGSLDDFAWLVTRPQALAALETFVAQRLPDFGRWQDALWPGEPWLWHAQLSAAMNLKLIHPREVVARVEAAWRAGAVPLPSAEGFIRQVLGWREFVRGVYWTRMPALAGANALDAHEPLPSFYWTGDTEMACLSDALRQTLAHGYAHHIQRLMVTGLFALLLGVEPSQVHAWYLAVYVDAVEWVEMPNTLGMSQYADGGFMTSKPYVASGRYIERMSSGAYCARCPYRPGLRAGPDACPFTTLYWDFLWRHRQRFSRHPRLGTQVSNAERLDACEREAIGEQAATIRRRTAARSETIHRPHAT